MGDFDKEGIELKFELDSEQMKRAFASLEKKMRDNMRALTIYRTKQSLVRQQVLNLRRQISLKNKSVDEILELFFKFRFGEKRSNKTTVPEYREATRTELDGLLAKYEKDLETLQEQCTVFNAQVDLTSFEKKLQRLQQASKKIPTDYRPFVYEQMQTLLYAARDALHNTSWNDCIEGMNLMWRALKQACTRLLGISTLLQEEQAYLSRGPEYYGLDIPSKPYIDDRTYQFIDDKIKLLFEQLEPMRKQVLVSAEDVVKMRHDIRQLLRGARTQNICFTPIQRAALQELRAETRRMLATVTPSRLVQAREYLASHALSTQGMFKKLIKQGKDDMNRKEPDQDKPFQF